MAGKNVDTVERSELVQAQTEIQKLNRIIVDLQQTANTELQQKANEEYEMLKRIYPYLARELDYLREENERLEAKVEELQQGGNSNVGT